MPQQEIAIIGAGKLGKGYLADLFGKAGYAVTFITRRSAQAARLRAQGYYTVCLEHENGAPMEQYRVSGFSAWCSENEERAACIAALCRVHMAGISIYPDGFAGAARLLAEAISARKAQGAGPLDILLLINVPAPDVALDAYIRSHLSAEEIAYYETHVGLIKTLAIRDGFTAPAAVLAEDPEAICASDYPELPVDRDAFRGEIPAVPGILPLGKMKERLQAKLWTSNMKNGTISAAGVYLGHTAFSDAALDGDITALCAACKREALYAIAHGLGMEEAEYKLGEYKAPPLLPGVAVRPTIDVFERQMFGLKRKLGYTERFVGPAVVCAHHGRMPVHLAKAAALAFLYENPEDPDAVEVQGHLAAHGIRSAVYQYCGLGSTHPAEAALAEMICSNYTLLRQQQHGQIASRRDALQIG